MTAVAQAAVAPPGKGNGSDEVAAPVVPPISQLCPHTQSPCMKIPACALLVNTGKTYCVEWVEAQRAAGRQQLEGRS